MEHYNIFQNLLKACTRFLDGIYDTMNILVDSGNFGTVSRDENAADKYYIVIFVSSTYTIKIWYMLSKDFGKCYSVPFI